MFFLCIMVLMEKKIIEGKNGLIDICTPPPPLKLYLQDCG
jgi:hypothetical protein